MSNKRKLKEMQVQLDKLQAHTVRLTSDVSGLIAKVCEPVPKSKTLDQSVFDGLDEKWRFAAVVEDGRALYFNKRPCSADDITGHFVFKGDYQAIRPTIRIYLTVQLPSNPRQFKLQANKKRRYRLR